MQVLNNTTKHDAISLKQKESNTGSKKYDRNQINEDQVTTLNSGLTADTQPVIVNTPLR